jgi:hypothetical protein
MGPKTTNNLFCFYFLYHIYTYMLLLFTYLTDCPIHLHSRPIISLRYIIDKVLSFTLKMEAAEYY